MFVVEGERSADPSKHGNLEKNGLRRLQKCYKWVDFNFSFTLPLNSSKILIIITSDDCIHQNETISFFLFIVSSIMCVTVRQKETLNESTATFFFCTVEWQLKKG